MKIPVGKTIVYAYTFTAANLLTLIGLSWIAHLISTVASYFLTPYLLTAGQPIGTDPAAAIGRGLQTLGSSFLLSAVTLFSLAMIAIAFARQALGLRTGPALYYFSLDRSFWRLIGAYLLFGLIFVGVAFPIVLVVGIVAAAGGAVPQGNANLVVGAAAVAMILAIMIFLGLRLGFFMPSVASAEGQHVLRRAWSLSRGNFWRLFVVVLVTLLPFVVVFAVYQQLLTSFLGLARPPAGSDPEVVAAYSIQASKRMVEMTPYLFPISLVINAALFGCLTAAAAFAYRALVPAKEGIAEEFA